MWSEDRQVAVIFNGEIYNHLELRRQLTQRGHRFASDHSDTEVLVHGWRNGLKTCRRGSTACLLSRSTIAGEPVCSSARDRFGEKPLYFFNRSGLFAFASELTALACHSEVPRSIDSRALQKLFAYGYIPAPRALLEGTRKLPGGNWLRFDLCDSMLSQHAYWQFRLEPDEGLGAEAEPRLIDELEALLGAAGRRRLMSDVPLGVFLSGGIDSSLVLATLAAARPDIRLDSFTVGFTEPSFDESPYARAVAAHIGSRHHERVLEMDRTRELIPSVLSRLDEPLGDASILPTAMLSAFARESVTVALSGDGGDELFAGYDPFLALKPAEAYARLMPAWGHRGLRRLVELLPIAQTNMSLDFKLRRSLMGLSYPAGVRLPVWMAPLEPREIAELLETPVRIGDIYDEAIALWERGDRHHPVDRALEFFTTFYLQDDILMKVDRAAMMHLSRRAPFFSITT